MRRTAVFTPILAAMAAVTLVLAPAAADSGPLYRDEDGEHELCEDGEYPVYRDASHTDIAGCETAKDAEPEQPEVGDEPDAGGGSGSAGDAPGQDGPLYRDEDGEHELCEDGEYPVYRDASHTDIAGCETR